MTSTTVHPGNYVQELRPHLCRTEADPRPVVMMTSGVAGSGKSTLAHSIISAYPSFKRFSIDWYIYSNHGLYGVDYPRQRYEEYQLEGEEALRAELAATVERGDVDVVLDFSFAFREVREAWKSLIEREGGRWVLVYLDVDAAELRRRVKARNERVDKDGDSAFYMTDEILERYISGFERPVGEGEIVL
ncbi:hypothetical protein ETB97_003936 [Aspergillus alliaceus]|uniref:P-loop containing nucleoside triphosphate hydrolase protein n=1 Tax=Petromyces alliaceus TaxID=209559 RepID=A0A8H6A3C0_PETAA|nr:hypothetical protein ETB97_003936 [Aspergillus burnettii]